MPYNSSITTLLMISVIVHCVSEKNLATILYTYNVGVCERLS